MRENHWLDEAIRLAYENVADGGRPFGALVVRDSVLVAEGADRVLQDVDPTAHAELLALRAASRQLGALQLDDCLLVSSTEPCALCQAAALLAGVPRCLYATSLQEANAAGLGLELDEVARELLRPAGERTRLELVHRPLPFALAPLDRWRQHGPRARSPGTS